MADPFNLFNYYRRYKWTAANFNELQNSLIAESDGIAEGTFQGATLSGLEVTSPSGLNISAASGIAVGPTGYLMGFSGQTILASAPTGGMPAKSLVVLRPVLIPNSYITNPTAPLNSVPLKFERAASAVFIPGTPSNTPEYPTKGVADVILAGVKLASGQSSISTNDFDFEVREEAGMNSDIKNETLHFDDRLLPYRNSYKSVGIKPSQTGGSKPKLFIYPKRSTPSKFPKDISGNFNLGDTFLDFVTGAITGADAISPNFTPVAPTAGNSIIATVSLNASDEITVLFGTEGTLAQCLTAIENQTGAGPGSLNPTQDRFNICQVILTSISGSISDLRVIDTRPIGVGEAGVGNLNAKFTLEGAFVPYTTIDGPHRVTVAGGLSAINISAGDSGTSGNSMVRINQYRSGALISNATATLTANSGLPDASNASLSASLSLLVNDVLTLDAVSGALGSPSDFTIEF